jgi:hypothetical protein
MNCSRHLKQLATVLMLVVCCAILAGCSGDATRRPVEGTVTLDGVPVDGGVIQFLAQGDDAHGKRINVHADIKDGKYYLATGAGPNLGIYKVMITWAKKTGRQVEVAGDKGNTVEETVDAIPRKFNALSSEIVEIKSTGNKFDYSIRSEKESKKAAHR